MTKQAEKPGAAEFRRVLEDLAASRGMSLEELAHKADATGRALGRISSEGLRGERLEEPPGNFGAALDAVLGMSQEERERVVDGFLALITKRHENATKEERD